MTQKRNKATRTVGDAYSKEERNEIAANIIRFIESGWNESFVESFGVIERKRSRLTFEQIKWLGVIHDDVLGRIEHN
jgi:hypothetical protein